MNVCTNCGLDQSSRLGANAGYVVLCARLCAQRADECALAIADSRKMCRLPIVSIAPMSVCTNLGLDQSSRLCANAGYVVLHARLRTQRAHEYALAIANEHKYSRVLYVPCPLF
jgi:hypothetical protein